MYSILHFFAILLIHRGREWYHDLRHGKRKKEMKNLFLPDTSVQGGKVIIEGDAFHHLKHVRRVRGGEALHAVVGRCRYDLTVSAVERTRIVCSIEAKRGVKADSGVPIRVYQGLLKQRKMDTVAVKLAELGVAELIPVLTERTVPPGSGAGRVERWRKLAREGAKVAGTETPMSVLEPRPLQQVLKSLNKGINGVIILFCTEHATVHLRTYLESLTTDGIGDFNLFFGPEGGFTEQEAALVAELKGVCVTMGPLVLRSETAAIVGTGFVRLFHTP
jgi:16S rRNA (uracil1498-N3)-methyltransferase